MLATAIAYQLVGGGGWWDLRGAGMPKKYGQLQRGEDEP